MDAIHDKHGLGPAIIAGPAPLLTLRGLPVVLVLSVLLMWPLVVGQAIYVFWDTPSYFRGGAKIWGTFFHMTSGLLGGGDVGGSGQSGASLAVNAKGASVTGRSFTYSSFAYSLNLFLGTWAISLAQALMMVVSSAALVSRQAMDAPRVLMVGMLVMVFLSPLPWFSVYLMPDVFGAVLLIFGMVLVRDFDELRPWQKVVLTLLAGFAGSAHYGNAPLILGIVLWVFIIRAVGRRLTWASVLAGVFAAAFAPVSNLAASSAVLDEASVTPKRMPIALSRSLSDGPALWYLQEVCPDAGFAICDAFGDELRGDTIWFLWSDDGLKSLEPEVVDQIRAEEMAVLVGAFKAYPLQQSASLLRNGWLQMFRIGTRGVHAASGLGPDFEPDFAEDEDWGERLVRAFSPVTALSVLAGALVLGGLLLARRLDRRQVEVLLIMVIGLVGNAFIFGGLSSPIERYQSRLAWVIPLIAIVYLAESLSRRRGT